MDKGILLATKTLVESIRHYIRDLADLRSRGLKKCNVSPRAISKQLLPSRKQNGGFDLASL